MNPDFILSYENCKINVADIDKTLSDKQTIDNPASLLDQLNNLQGLQGLSAQTLGSCEYHLLKAQELAILAGSKTKLPPSIFKEYIKSQCAEQIALYTICDRQNAALVHASESLRTIISYQKQELMLIHGSNNQKGG